MGLKGREDSRCGLKGKINGFEEIRGYSAYEVALINGFDGTEEEWLASLKGTTDELPPPVYLVTCTGNLVDQPINDILAAYQAGRSVKLKHGDHLLNLMHVSDVDLLFSSTSGSINYSAVVNMQHKTILYSETTLAKKIRYSDKDKRTGKRQRLFSGSSTSKCSGRPDHRSQGSGRKRQAYTVGSGRFAYWR